MTALTLTLYNTLSRRKQPFSAIDDGHVRLYACGPTVYDRIHIGNARPLVVFDVLVRLLRRLYPQVTYVRNITDVDDKINARAAERGISISSLCDETTASFHSDADALNVERPDIEPRATDHIAEMIEMIGRLIAGGFAYVAQDHVLFSVKTMPAYGQLSGRTLDEMIAGARVEVAPYKADPADFVLWKPSEDPLPGWQSPWGRGRPGWHIECSAMSAKYLGDVFDIHAGGLDLVFPHHENEIAQSCCAHNTEYMARYWLHNGYVTVNGEKMSKSLGNFTTVEQAISSVRPEAVRYGLLSTHYRAPFDYSDTLMDTSVQALDRLYRASQNARGTALITEPDRLDSQFVSAMLDDLNTPLALSALHRMAAEANKGSDEAALQLLSCAACLGLLGDNSWFTGDDTQLDRARIEALIAERNDARAKRDFARADEIRDRLADMGVRLLDSAQGTRWERA